MSEEVEIVGAWHHALNGGDGERLMTLSHPGVEMGGPRGVVRGVRILREWMDRANIRLEPRRIFHGGCTVVVEEWAEWRSADTGQVTGSQVVTSVFTVVDGLVASVARHEDLASALRAAELDETSEVEMGGLV